MANLELMNYKPQRDPVSEQELIAYRSLCADSRRGTVKNGAEWHKFNK